MNNRIKFFFEDRFYFEAYLDNISIVNRFIHVKIPNHDFKGVYPIWMLKKIMDCEAGLNEISLMEFNYLKIKRNEEIHAVNEADCQAVKGLAEIFN
ncbi:hypothetical protein [Candidatus Lokiarchaeum ossiferum]|uniref:hypothetical protein n=1 Tax=Candidatus Lokiarchaeum ossiferum TaxID=2951803 RepID=UPI00352F76D4